MFQKISQNSQENICIKVLLLIKACNFLEKETLTQVFSSEFCELFKSTFL